MLGNLLEADCEVVADQVTNGIDLARDVRGTEVVRRRLPGHGRLWRLILLSRSNLSLITSSCSSKPDAAGQPRSGHAVTISQGRLLRLLPRLATLDMQAISSTPFADLFPLPGDYSEHVGPGLMQWAALSMVDTSDLLMHFNLIDFFETLVSVMRVSTPSAENEGVLKSLLGAAAHNDSRLAEALSTLPDRTVEEEADALRRYITHLLG